MPTPYVAQTTPLEVYRAQAVDIARDLCYSPETIASIYNAETETELSNILTTARNRGEVYYGRKGE